MDVGDGLGERVDVVGDLGDREAVVEWLRSDLLFSERYGRTLIFVRLSAICYLLSMIVSSKLPRKRSLMTVDFRGVLHFPARCR